MTRYAAIGSDEMAIYGVGDTPDAALADARRGSGDPDATYRVVPCTEPAYSYVMRHGGAPSDRLVVSRYGVTHRDEACRTIACELHIYQDL